MEVPLPKILFSDLDGELPALALERLPGKDLAFVVDELSEPEKQEIAARVMQIQQIVRALPSAGLYGYAVAPELAPHRRWTDCLHACVDRSRWRIDSAGIVRARRADLVDQAIQRMRPELGEITASPFLHDLTTKNVIVHEGRLSGIVDVDDLCYGDPLFQIALTKVALLSQGSSLSYIDCLLACHGEYSRQTLDLYTAIFCLDFLAEIGQRFNGNAVDESPERIALLEGMLGELCAALFR